MALANDKTYGGGVAVVPSDSTAVDFHGLYIGSAGNVTVTGGDGNDVLFTAPTVGEIIPMRIIKVKATGTNIVTMVGLLR